MRRVNPRIRWNAPLLLATALLAGCAAAEPAAPPVDLAAEEAAIRARSQALVAAEQARDVAAVAAFYAEDAVVQPAGMPAVAGRTAFQEFFAGMIAQLPPEWSFSSRTGAIRLSTSGDMAIETGVNEFVTGGATTMGKYLAVWQKIDGQWMVAALSWSDDTPPPPQG